MQYQIMQQRTSNELVAFSIIALLTMGNLFYLILPSLTSDELRLSAVERNETVASIDRTQKPPTPVHGHAGPQSGQQLSGAQDREDGTSAATGLLLQSNFAVVFESRSSLTAIEQQWRKLRESMPDRLENLMPLARIEQDANTSGISLHLALGPFQNAQDAARACLAFQRRAAGCHVGPFSGQPLEMLGHAALFKISQELLTLQKQP